ncbi:MAG TPA: polysaccharide biosynthesis/export family protein [Acidobacteriaceae bacterium]|jgi:polysaccharide export outer membrane protein
MIRQAWLTIISVASLTLCGLQAEAQIPSNPVTITSPAIRVASGDLIDVNVFDAPELSGHYRVDELGDVRPPLIGVVHVAGLTAGEIGLLFEQKLMASDILTRPHVNVNVTEYATQGITITGQVKSPGVFPALGVRMFNDVMTAAGGVTSIASTEIQITHRNDPSHPETVHYNPESLTPEIPQVQLLPGDTVIVPRAGTVYVLGNIQKPGIYVIEGRRPLTFEQLMAQTGPGGNGAKMKEIRLFTPKPDGGREERVLSYRAITEGKSPDVILHDGDILYIPTSGLKLASERALESAISIGTSLALYHIAYNQ